MTAFALTGTSLTERLLDCFPCGSYAINALLRLVEIVESEEVNSAAVECSVRPRMLINPVFVSLWAQTPEKLLMLVMHELHHVLLGHTRLFKTVTKVDNLVLDAVINALLCRMFPQEEHTRFFTDFYSDSEFPACLLRPPRGWRPEDDHSPTPPGLADTRFAEIAEVYRALYSPAGATYHDLYHVLRRLVTEREAASVVLVGGHRDVAIGEDLEEGSPLLFEAVRKVVERWPQPPDPIAGRSLDDLLRDTSVTPRRQPSNRAVLRSLLRRIADRSGPRGAIRDVINDRLWIDSPVPTADRRSLVQYALGAKPLLHRTKLCVRRPTLTGQRVHVYLDVSGSVRELRGAIYGALLDCREFVQPVVHLFSTRIVDVRLADLRRGACSTTGGTEIDCIGEHVRQHRISRAVIVTDGYTGEPGGQNGEALRAARIGVALTPGTCTRGCLEAVVDHWAQLKETGSEKGKES